MEQRPFGSTGVSVPVIGEGTWNMERGSRSECVAAIRRALDIGVTHIDTAEMYSVPPKAETCGHTETIIGNWFAKNPGARQKLVLATKVAGPSRGMPWIRDHANLTVQDFLTACEASLRRLQTDVIDLYQIHWPERHVPAFGGVYYDPQKETSQITIHAQLEALAQLVKAGKVRHVGLSNETPYGVHEFVRLAEQHGLPRIATTQNPYCLINRTYENGLDETCHRLNVSLLAYSPLGFGLLTGKYDTSGITGPDAPKGARISGYESVRKQRWGRPESLVAARRYNALAQENGMTPTQMALAFCYTKWQVTSTIIGVTSVAQLDADLDAWGSTLSPEVLAAIDAIRWELRDPAQ